MDTTVESQVSKSARPGAPPVFSQSAFRNDYRAGDVGHPPRILKFWTAIERTVSLRIRDRVSTRAAIFSAEASEFRGQSEKCQRLYSVRSEIVHGTYKGGGEKLVLSAKETERISQSVITSYAFLASRLKAARRLTRDGIEAEFKRLDRISSRTAVK